jgi:hypothetical protein
MVNVGDNGDVTDVFASNHTDAESKLKGRAFLEDRYALNPTGTHEAGAYMPQGLLPQ